MTKGHCPSCLEIRTDTFDDVWGFAFVASVPQCLRCGSIVELKENGQSWDGDAEEAEDEDAGIGF